MLQSYTVQIIGFSMSDIYIAQKKKKMSDEQYIVLFF